MIANTWQNVASISNTRAAPRLRYKSYYATVAMAQLAWSWIPASQQSPQHYRITNQRASSVIASIV